MKSEAILDLQWGEFGAEGIPALQALTLHHLAPFFDGLTALLVMHQVEGFAHLLRKLLVLFHLLFGVPEPLVDLRLLQTELFD